MEWIDVKGKHPKGNMVTFVAWRSDTGTKLTTSTAMYDSIYEDWVFSSGQPYSGYRMVVDYWMQIEYPQPPKQA